MAVSAWRGGSEEPEAVVEFRLTYEGELLSTRVFTDTGTGPAEDKKSAHKHRLRKHFHPQLKRLVDERLKPWWRVPIMPEGGTRVDRRVKEHASDGFNWVPLITDNPNDFPTICALSILYLRQGVRGSVLSNADLDNRVKTLIDALAIPKRNQLPLSAPPTPEEDPFFVLLASDNLVTRLDVEADTLLSPTTTPDTLGDTDSRCVITVRVSREAIVF